MRDAYADRENAPLWVDSGRPHGDASELVDAVVDA
jgi:hypothetical protein